MAGRNVIFENGKQNTISAGSFKKFEIPKTNEVVEVSTPEQLAKDFSDLLNYEKQKSIIKVQNKVYGEVLGKPITQIQLENIGVDVKVRNSGVKIDGTTKIGDEIDNLKNSLGHNFPVYDKLETKNGPKNVEVIEINDKDLKNETNIKNNSSDTETNKRY